MSRSEASGGRTARRSGKRFLVLVNGARDHKPFYSRLGAELVRRGHEVHYAVDSHYTDHAYPEASFGSAPAHFFSDYFRAHFGREALPAFLVGENVGALLLSDTDRWSHTFFGKRGDERYYPSLAACLGHFFAELFERERFDAVLYENASNAFASVALAACRHYGARYFGFVHSRLPGRTDVAEGMQRDCARLKRRFEAVRRDPSSVSPETWQWVSAYLANLEVERPDYLSARRSLAQGPLARYASVEAARRAWRSWSYALSGDDRFYAFQVPHPLFAHAEQLVNEVARVASKAVLERFYFRRPFQSVRPYFLYPTQFHPESSTSVDGAGFEDEWSNVKRLSANLPHRALLYVREHPLACGRAGLAFYERLRRLPNVRLIGPEASIDELIARCRAVVCVTSTVGFDALVRGRPVFVLGRPFYSFAPGCVSLDGFDGLHAALEGAARVDVTDTRALLAAYYESSLPRLFDLETQRFLEGAEHVIADFLELAEVWTADAPLASVHTLAERRR